jgi:hypothetical protein
MKLIIIDKVKTLHTWCMSCALCVRVYLAALCSMDAAAFVLGCVFVLALYWNHFTSTVLENLIHNRLWVQARKIVT